MFVLIVVVVAVVAVAVVVVVTVVAVVVVVVAVVDNVVIDVANFYCLKMIRVRRSNGSKDGPSDRATDRPTDTILYGDAYLYPNLRMC